MSADLLRAKLSLEAELSRPMASLLMGYVARWEQAGGTLALTDRLSAQMNLRALLERHYARTVSVVLGQRPTPATTIGTVALSMAHGERLRTRAHARAILILRSMDRDLAADPSVKSAGALSQIETKDEPTGRIGYSTRLRATAAQAYFKLRAKIRAIVNAETEEPAEEAMFEWVTQGKANAPVVKAWVTVGDERVRDSHVAAGETYGADGGAPIPVDQAFQLAGGQVRFPGDTSLGVSMREIYNCRCSLAYYAQTPDGLVPLTLTTPTLPTRKPWRPGHRFGEEIPVRATESVTLNGRTRARVVLGDNRTFATLSQTTPSTITVTIDGQVVARATHANGVVTQIVVAPGRESLGIERLIRESVLQSWARTLRGGR